MAMHPDARAFLSRVLDDPSDEIVRLVFADWLDELGDVASRNWAKYIRLRTEAAARHGTERELLRDDAANIAPALRVRLNVPLGKVIAHFPSLIDLLPPDRYTVGVHSSALAKPCPVALQLGEKIARTYRHIVVAEHFGTFAALAVYGESPVRVPNGLISRLQGHVTAFPCEDVDFRRLLAAWFPAAVPESLSSTSSEFEERIDPAAVEELGLRLWREAAKDGARALEVMAMPGGFEVRATIEGRPQRRSTLTPNEGENLVAWYRLPSTAKLLNVEITPRNTGFGEGVRLEPN